MYNHKRHGVFIFGNQKFDFKIKKHFPNKLSPEFLLVDLVNNLDCIAEDKHRVLKNVLKTAQTMDLEKLKTCVEQYAISKTKKLLAPVVSDINFLDRNKIKQAR